MIRMLIVMLFLVTAATDLSVRAEPEAAPAAAKATTAIKSLIDNDILQGDYFGANPTPNQPVTLAFYAVLLSRTLDLPAPAATTAPAGPSHWYAPSVATANRYGFFSNVAAPANPTQLINREAAAAAAIRAATATHILHYEASPRSFPRFADEDSISASARTACHQAVSLGLLTVGPDNLFQPHKMVTFGETAVVMQGLLQQKKTAGDGI